MRAVIWVVEGSWERCVDRARELLPADAEVTLLHVSPSDVEALAAHPAHGLLGRHHTPPPGPTVHEISEAEAQSLLRAARDRLGRQAELVARRGRVEREVIEACEGSDLLVLARDGEPRREPTSLGRWSRFIVDHAGCAVLLVWAQAPSGLESMRWPPHLR
jgi:nucleotide-binding universal stress UspA family protein